MIVVELEEAVLKPKGHESTDDPTEKSESEVFSRSKFPKEEVETLAIFLEEASVVEEEDDSRPIEIPVKTHAK